MVANALGVLARDGPEAGWCVVERGRFKLRYSTPFNAQVLKARPVSRAELIWSWSYGKAWYRLEILENGTRVLGVLWNRESDFLVRSFRMYCDPPWDKRFRRWAIKLLEYSRLQRTTGGTLAMVTRADRPAFRRCARLALEQRGLSVRPMRGKGLVPGVRLEVGKSGEKRKQIAVRTSRDRKVGLMRFPSGNWRTVPKVQEVVVVAPALNDPKLVEVLGFSPEKLIAAFDALVLKTEGMRRKKHFKSPVFIALDPQSDGSEGDLRFDLKSLADWSVTLPFMPEGTGVQASTKESGFIERVRREFAELTGADVSKVIVNFYVVGHQ
jgi:hypothetical protein